MAVKRAAVVFVATAAAVLATTSTASAYHGDRVPAASHGVLGTTIVNHGSKVHTTIIDTYRYRRVSHGHRVYVRGIVISAQRCWSGECHGRAVEAKLWSPHQLGHAPARASRGSGSDHPDGAVSEVCIGANMYCGAPWNWLNRNVNDRIAAFNNNVSKPCAVGGLAGYGVKVSESTAGMALAEGATLTAAERAAAVFGPEGFAVGTLAGCFVGIGAHGISSIKHIASALNPFDRTAPRKD